MTAKLLEKSEQTLAPQDQQIIVPDTVPEYLLRPGRSRTRRRVYAFLLALGAAAGAVFMIARPFGRTADSDYVGDWKDQITETAEQTYTGDWKDQIAETGQTYTGDWKDQVAETRQPAYTGDWKDQIGR